MKFSIGDRVRVYNYSTIWTGEVSNIMQDGMLYVKPDPIQMDDNVVTGTSHYLHPKQCRKLVNKNPPALNVTSNRTKRIWVNPNSIRDDLDWYNVNFDYKNRGPHWIEFREVKRATKS